MDLQDYINELTESGKNTRFDRLRTICTAVFGEPTIKGSHHYFKTPWQGKPLVNIQPDKGGKAKYYQVKEVVKALKRAQEDEE